MTSMARRLYVTVVEWAAIALCLSCIPCKAILGRGARLAKNRRAARLFPPPIPTARVDIRQRPMAEQAQNSRLLSLPPELRQLVYEHALGGRLVKIQLAASKYHTNYVFASTFYQPVDNPDKILLLQHRPPADDIPVALLLSCRQVYLEALPILHRRNTFYFLIHDFHMAAIAALGQYCLKDIRSVYLRDNSTALGIYFDSQWSAAFLLLRQMCLESLTIELPASAIVDEAKPHPHEAVLDSVWGRGIVKVRGLQRFTLFFTRGDPPLLPGFNHSILGQLRAIVTGEKVDEDDDSFLSDG
ncbi:hypothetical protein MSAN_01246700 [Mycena sanguinolenta]|uniref:DUF7730 domain-containing protein n=1 Tax=Mycena sanguinolenta TaxID=230812 RepID=A0A8H6YH78_9AGAR|nr:hypothetical protein MSAN_01246700 [Mycena sanguinolenta]